jgi:hypothetical protein
MSEMDVNALATRLRDLLSNRQPVMDEEDDGRGPPRSVPYHRFRQELDARKAMDAHLAEMTEQLEALQQGYQSQLEAMREQMATEVKSLQQAHNEDIQLIEAGFDDQLGRQTLRSVWNGMPKGERGDSISGWWAGQLEAHKAHVADPEAVAAPAVMRLRPLTPYLPTIEPPKAEEPPAPQQDVWGRPPAPPAARQTQSLESVPVDQGMDAFYSGLRQLSGQG